MAEEIVYDLTDSRYWICKYLMVDTCSHDCFIIVSFIMTMFPLPFISMTLRVTTEQNMFGYMHKNQIKFKNNLI